jgi:hypothetical protein
MGDAYSSLVLLKNGKKWEDEETNLVCVLYDELGASVIAATEDEVEPDLGLYIATMDLTGVADGWYTAMWTHNSVNKVLKSETILVSNEEHISADIGIMADKLPTNNIMGSDDKDDHNAELEDWANAGRLDAILDAIRVDTLTTIPAHLTDIKGTSFVKDTHSLIDILGFVDLIDDVTDGLAAIKTQANKIDDQATTVPSSCTTGSLLDRICNADGGKTYDQSQESLEAIRARGDTAWGAAGTSNYVLMCVVNTSGGVMRLAAWAEKNGQIVAATNLSLTIYKMKSGPTTEEVVTQAATETNNVFYKTLSSFAPSQGELYVAVGTVDADGGTRNVASYVAVL